MQPDAINRSVAGIPGNLQSAKKSAQDGKSPVVAQESLNTTNWILDPPETLIAAKDFHFAIAASFRMTQSMGNEFLFDEVR